jgi:TorA maturation chaperone TorD
MKDANSEAQLIDRKSLAALQALAGKVDAENIGTTQRNIANQRLQLLDQIRNDPELYRAITSQLRADAAAGTIAGQRAANVGTQAQTADQSYDASAAELYKSLFTGDTAVADATRNSIYSNQNKVADNYIQGQLNNMSKAAQDELTKSENIKAAMEALSTALGVDVDKYDDTIAEQQAQAKANASKLTTDLDNKIKEELAIDDAQLQYILNLFNTSSAELDKALSNNGDATAAVQELIRQYNDVNKIGDVNSANDYLASSNENSTGSLGTNIANNLKNTLNSVTASKTPTENYTKLDLSKYWSSDKLENIEYDDVVNNEVYQSYLANIGELTRYKTLDELKKQFGLDMLDEEGLQKLFEANAEAANKQSDRIFNDAQRAYIAAITAGDAKTAEQLTRLAVSTGGAKGNLYKSTALANNYAQQRANAPTGMQLATDFQNQQSANKAAVAQSAIDANSALTNYIGSGTDNAGKGTLYGAAVGYDQAAANNTTSFGGYGNNKMTAGQQLNTIITNSDIANYDRLSEVTNHYNSTNAHVAANKISNTGSKLGLLAEVEALAKTANKK